MQGYNVWVILRYIFAMCCGLLFGVGFFFSIFRVPVLDTSEKVQWAASRYIGTIADDDASSKTLVVVIPTSFPLTTGSTKVKIHYDDATLWESQIFTFKDGQRVSVQNVPLVNPALTTGSNVIIIVDTQDARLNARLIMNIRRIDV